VRLAHNWPPFQSTLPVKGATYTASTARKIMASFQSTLPVKGATWCAVKPCAANAFQSTLPVKGATSSMMIRTMPSQVSIHAPSEGSDPVGALFDYVLDEFQSTLPVKGATPTIGLSTRCTWCFNPRSQ